MYPAEQFAFGSVKPLEAQYLPTGHSSHDSAEGRFSLKKLNLN